MPSPLVCDFCSLTLTVESAWDCPARDFDTGVPSPTGAHPTSAAGRVNHHSAGGWAACQRCASLVRSGQRERLLDRAVKRFLERRPEFKPIRADLARALRELHDGFWRNRLGAPRRVDPTDFAIAEAAPAQFERDADAPLRTADWVKDLIARGRL